MRFIFPFFFLLFSFSANGRNVENYLSNIDTAEAYLIESNFIMAQAYYKKAFDASDKPFAVDISNYLKCSNLNKDYSMVKDLCTKLISLGCTLSYFENPKYFREFRTSKYWAGIIDSYPILRRNYLKNNDFKLRTSIEQLQAKDQLLRRQDPNYTFFRDSIYKNDDSIKISLNNIFKTKFPNEYDYGVFLSDDTTLLDYEPLHILILHNYCKLDILENPDANPRTFDFTKILMNAMKNGYIHPEEFALLNDRSGKFKIGEGYGQMGLLYNIKNELYYDIQGDTIKAQIEKNRKKIGLCNRNEGRKKLIFDAKGNKNKFILRRSLFGITIFPGNLFTDKDIEKLFVDTKVSLK